MEPSRPATWLSTGLMWLAIGALTLITGVPLVIHIGSLPVAGAVSLAERVGLVPSSPPYETATIVGLAGAVLAGLVGFAGGLVRGLRGESAETGGSFVTRSPFLSVFLHSAVAGGVVALSGRAGSEEAADALAVVGAPALVIATAATMGLAWKNWVAVATAVARFGRASTPRAFAVAAAGATLALTLTASAGPVDAVRRLGPTTAVFQPLDAPEHWSAGTPILGGTLALPFPRGSGDRISPEVRRFEDCVEQLAPEHEGALGGAVMEARRLGERHFDSLEAEDLAIATLLAICKKYQGSDIDNLRPYYFRALQNAFGKRWRAPRNEPWHAESDGPGAESHEISALDALIKAQDLRCLGEAMRLLPDEDRRVVYAWIEHESHPRVAKQLKINPDAARKRFSRALETLAPIFRQQCQ